MNESFNPYVLSNENHTLYLSNVVFKMQVQLLNAEKPVPHFASRLKWASYNMFRFEKKHENIIMLDKSYVRLI